jgi:hypothetical protein
VVALELHRDPGGPGPGEVEPNPQALTMTRPPLAAKVMHACRKDTELPQGMSFPELDSIAGHGISVPQVWGVGKKTFVFISL